MRKNKKLVGLIIIFLVLSNFIITPRCLAQDPIKKLGRGVANLGLGWVTLFTTIEDTGKSEGIPAAATYGILKGIAKAIQRTLVGAYEALTFPLPAPKDYKPILTNPEFPLGREAKE